jgi:hypothetical protein
MSSEKGTASRVHDLVGAVFGFFAAVMLATIRWQIDTSGPDPFYKGASIFPILVLSLMVLASLPAIRRLFRPPTGASWYLDGTGIPVKPAIAAALLVLYIAGLVYVGLAAASWLFMFVCLWVVGQRTPLKLVLVPTLMTALLYFLFVTLLDVFFATPVLFEYFME